MGLGAGLILGRWGEVQIYITCKLVYIGMSVVSRREGSITLEPGVKGYVGVLG